MQPVGGNAGTSIGAALYAWHNHYGQKERIPFRTLCLGASYSPQQVKQVLENCKLRFLFIPTEGELIDRAVQALNDFKVVAWMQGRTEFGPRALGNRSILASPQNPYSTENLNVYIKHRETFRKFAASVPAELAEKYFEVGPNANYLATVGKVRPEYRGAVASAVLGKDDLVRVHTVQTGRESDVSLPADCGRTLDRIAAALQHQFQSLWRPFGLYAPRCPAQLLLFGNRHSFCRKFRHRQMTSVSFTVWR